MENKEQGLETFPGARYWRSMQGAVDAILIPLGIRRRVVSMGTQFVNYDAWTGESFAHHLCDFFAANPNRVPNAGELRDLMAQANRARCRDPHIRVARMPARVNLRVARAIIGGGYHEAWHTKYSKRDRVRLSEVQPIIDLAEEVTLAGGKFDAKMRGLLMTLHHLVEDIRIERRGNEDFEGAKQAMVDLQDFILDLEKIGREKGATVKNVTVSMNARSIMLCAFRDLGLGYNSHKAREMIAFYKEHAPGAIALLAPGGILAPMLHEAKGLERDDHMGSLRVAMKIVVELWRAMQGANDDEEEPEMCCPQCGAGPKDLIIRSVKNEHGVKIRGRAELECKACGFKTEFDLPDNSLNLNQDEKEQKEDQEKPEIEDLDQDDVGEGSDGFGDDTRERMKDQQPQKQKDQKQQGSSGGSEGEQEEGDSETMPMPGGTPQENGEEEDGDQEQDGDDEQESKGSSGSEDESEEGAEGDEQSQGGASDEGEGEDGDEDGGDEQESGRGAGRGDEDGDESEDDDLEDGGNGAGEEGDEEDESEGSKDGGNGADFDDLDGLVEDGDDEETDEETDEDGDESEGSKDGGNGADFDDLDGLVEDGDDEETDEDGDESEDGEKTGDAADEDAAESEDGDEAAAKAKGDSEGAEGDSESDSDSQDGGNGTDGNDEQNTPTEESEDGEQQDWEMSGEDFLNAGGTPFDSGRDPKSDLKQAQEIFKGKESDGRLTNQTALDDALADQMLRDEKNKQIGERVWNPWNPMLDEARIVRMHDPSASLDLATQMLQEVRASVTYLGARLRTIVKAQEMTDVAHGIRRGRKLSQRTLVDTAIDIRRGRMPTRAYQVTDAQIDTSIDMAICLDQSSSMAHMRYPVAQVQMILADAVERVGGGTFAFGFRDGPTTRDAPRNWISQYHRVHGIRYDVFKTWDEKFTNVKGRFAHTQAVGMTPMSDGVQFGLQALEDRRAGHRILAVITDGYPTRPHAEVVRRQIRLAAEGGIQVIGIGIGDDARYVFDLFGMSNAVWSATVEEMPNELLKKLNDLCDFSGRFRGRRPRLDGKGRITKKVS